MTMTKDNKSTRSVRNSTQYKIFKMLESLEQLKNTDIDTNDDYTCIVIKSKWKSMPDYKLIWCNNKHHFRVYIKIVDDGFINYAMFVIKDTLATAGFINMYGFIHKNRANDKTPTDQ